MNEENSQENKDILSMKQNSENAYLLLFSDIKKQIKLLESFSVYIKQYSDVISVFSGQLNELNMAFLKGEDSNSFIKNSPLFHIGKIIKNTIQLQINYLLNITNNLKIFDDITNEFSNLILIFRDYQKILEDNPQAEDKPNSKIKSTIDSLMEKYEEIENKIVDGYISIKYNENVDMKEDFILENKIEEVHFLEKTFFGFEEISKKDFIKDNQEIEKKAINSFNILKNQIKNFVEIILKNDNINLINKQNEIDFIWNNTRLKEDKNISSKSGDSFKYCIRILMDPKINIIERGDNIEIFKSQTQVIPKSKLENKEEKKKSKLNFFKMFNKEKENFHEVENKEENKKKYFILNDEDIYNIVAKIYSLDLNFIDKSSYILDIEREKIEIRKLSEKLLGIDLNYNKTEPISDSEADKLISLLYNKENIYKFFMMLNNFRGTGKYEMSERVFNIALNIFNKTQDFLLKNKAKNIENLVIILSQTFYLIEDGNKKYIQEAIKNHPLFQSSEFWENQIRTNIDEHIEKNKLNIKKMNLDLSESEYQKRLDEIILSQFAPLSGHMGNFGISNDIILGIANKIFEYYHTGEKTQNLILSLLNK